MGAGHSTTQTVRIDNPQKTVPIEITPSVVTRLENAVQPTVNEHQKQQPTKETKETEEGDNCSNKQQQQQNEQHHQVKQPTVDVNPMVKAVYNNKLQNMEEEKFEETMNRMQSLFNSKSLSWSDEIGKEIVELKNKLIQCHKQYPGEPLSCADIAHQFQQVILREQTKYITNLANANKTNQEVPADTETSPYVTGCDPPNFK